MPAGQAVAFVRAVGDTTRQIIGRELRATETDIIIVVPAGACPDLKPSTLKASTGTCVSVCIVEVPKTRIYPMEEARQWANAYVLQEQLEITDTFQSAGPSPAASEAEAAQPSPHLAASAPCPASSPAPGQPTMPAAQGSTPGYAAAAPATTMPAAAPHAYPGSPFSQAASTGPTSVGRFLGSSLPPLGFAVCAP